MMGESRTAAFSSTGASRVTAIRVFIVVLAVAILGLTGCSTETPTSELSAPPAASYRSTGGPVIPPHVEVASWYGPGFQGHPTSTGERYNEYGLTAASKTLPLGTRVMVTNPANGRSVEVRINDRGPYVRGRSLDLSKGAAQRLGLTARGVAPVVVASPGATPSPSRYAPKHRVAVANYENTRSQRLAERMPPPRRSELISWPTPHRRFHHRTARTHHSYARSHPRKVWNPVGAWIAGSLRTF